MKQHWWESLEETVAIMEHKPLMSEIGERQRQSYFMTQGLEKRNSDFCIGNIRKNPI